jgi:hypothetical protein
MLIEGIDEGSREPNGRGKKGKMLRDVMCWASHISMYTYIHISARKMRGIIVQNEFFSFFYFFLLLPATAAYITFFRIRFCIKILRLGMGKDT